MAALEDPKLVKLTPVVVLQRLSLPEEKKKEEEEVAASGWSVLPVEILEMILSYLSSNGCVVTAGQVCCHWRSVAKRPSVWRRRQLDYKTAGWSQNWHAGARNFARVITFAPCLDVIRCSNTMKPFAKRAINTVSKCRQVRGLEVNGKLQWVYQYISRMEDTLEELSVTNPTEKCLVRAVNLPHLKTLQVKFQGEFYDRSYEVPIIPTQPEEYSSTITRLVCHSGVSSAAVQSLVRILCSSLQDVSVRCFPAAMEACLSLRRLQLPVNSASDQQRLRALVKAVRAASGPMEHVSFLGTGSHLEAACSAMRNQLLSDGDVTEAIECGVCSSPYAVAPYVVAAPFHGMFVWDAYDEYDFDYDYY